jgi:hypothetical protein
MDQEVEMKREMLNEGGSGDEAANGDEAESVSESRNGDEA